MNLDGPAIREKEEDVKTVINWNDASVMVPIVSIGKGWRGVVSDGRIIVYDASYNLVAYNAETDESTYAWRSEQFGMLPYKWVKWWAESPDAPR
jgi:hypothetical protein